MLEGRQFVIFCRWLEMLNSDTLKRVGVSVWRINTGLGVIFAFKQAALVFRWYF